MRKPVEMAKFFTLGLHILVTAWLLQACTPEPDPLPSKSQESPLPEVQSEQHHPSSFAAWPSPVCVTSPFKMCTQSDLREADFRQADLSGHVVFFNANAEDSNFSEANLSNAALHFSQFKRAKLEYIDLSGADLPGVSLVASNLERAQLRNINCLGCDFTGAQLQDSDFHGAVLRGSNMSYTDLRGANLSRADVTQILWHQTLCPDGSESHQNGGTCGGHLTTRSHPCSAGPNLQCADQDLSRIDWRAANLNHANLEATDLRQARLTGANLQGCNLTHSNLRGADFSHADLLGANLLRADLEKTTWHLTRCPDGTLSQNNGDTCGGHLDSEISACSVGPQASCEGADLAGLDLSFANLRGANLQGADLRGTRLVGANLQKANLQRANLQAADLSRADLTHAITEGADLTDIIAINAICTRKFSAKTGITCSENP
ncbi:MAG: pentapeptide repeat-containing protein [Deltaproteobacteria bacterium]|jgi:uncharacterized protein YjbI with pentapeptide repeats|nr:pentapeptide repeat-containing protein [Deltaproteobacteria bacterium]MBT6489596.1 pentapeptide repeat-containing protein [Deltaproteobacteria bacterium]